MENPADLICLGSRRLSIDDVVRVARKGVRVSITDDQQIHERVCASHEYVLRLVHQGEQVYGVTTGFGGLSNKAVSPSSAAELQENLLWFLKAGAGNRLPYSDVRASMIIRANSLLFGISGVRMELIRRFEIFLNAGATPHVRELGSIGASGDLVPLAAIAGSIVGLDNVFRVDLNGKELGARDALSMLNLEPLKLYPKEGLALVNGSSVMTGIAMNCLYDARLLMALSLSAHALMFQALRGNIKVLHPFIHLHKPHPGQGWVAKIMHKLVAGSKWTLGDQHKSSRLESGDLAQDRYSIRCLPQYMGPLLDGLMIAIRQVETEANSATDNPLLDGENNVFYEGGNFLGQYVGIAMDQIRHYLGLVAKHLDTQISLLVTPEFSHGLPASLVGNTERGVNMGLKGVQLTGNSIVPQLLHLGTPFVDRFQTHAEQFNQNINSLGFGAANLARQSVSLMRNYLAVTLIFCIQSVDLRAYREDRHYDARCGLSPLTTSLYETIHDLCQVQCTSRRAFIHDDCDQSLEDYIAVLADDMAKGGQLEQHVSLIIKSMEQMVLN